mmetsp:Transcript_39094/g.124462  ORF Transcript_39094/g.124462 Transcript_39094/m.124462 type:complete len:209 (-) Transcript_39094:277-903(-)
MVVRARRWTAASYTSTRPFPRLLPVPQMTLRLPSPGKYDTAEIQGRGTMPNRSGLGGFTLKVASWVSRLYMASSVPSPPVAISCPFGETARQSSEPFLGLTGRGTCHREASSSAAPSTLKVMTWPSDVHAMMDDGPPGDGTNPTPVMVTSLPPPTPGSAAVATSAPSTVLRTSRAPLARPTTRRCSWEVRGVAARRTTPDALSPSPHR